MIDRTKIGFQTTPTHVVIDAWRVKLLCQAIGEDDARYWDPAAAAAAAGHPMCPLPPTFLKTVEGEHFSSAALMQLLQVPLLGLARRTVPAHVAGHAATAGAVCRRLGRPKTHCTWTQRSHAAPASTNPSCMAC